MKNCVMYWELTFNNLKCLKLRYSTRQNGCNGEGLLSIVAIMCPHIDTLEYTCTKGDTDIQNIKSILVPSDLCLTTLQICCPLTLGSLCHTLKGSSHCLSNLQPSNPENVDHIQALKAIYHHCHYYEIYITLIKSEVLFTAALSLPRIFVHQNTLPQKAS